ncbi:MAG: hypothetical protein L0Z50_17780 [Verrucomicrobiales bacterium]|nr:hypothetical protein [Verrucomicrobiales bacterium]
MIPALLANVDTLRRLESVTKSTKMALADTLVVFVAGGAIFAALAVWLIYRRQRRKRVTGGEKVYRPNQSLTEEEAEAEETRRRYKRRVRRRDHRGRNPTLAETGGLPPVRPEPKSDAS